MINTVGRFERDNHRRVELGSRITMNYQCYMRTTNYWTSHELQCSRLKGGSLKRTKCQRPTRKTVKIRSCCVSVRILKSDEWPWLNSIQRGEGVAQKLTWTPTVRIGSKCAAIDRCIVIWDNRCCSSGRAAALILFNKACGYQKKMDGKKMGYFIRYSVKQHTLH